MRSNSFCETIVVKALWLGTTKNIDCKAQRCRPDVVTEVPRRLYILGGRSATPIPCCHCQAIPAIHLRCSGATEGQELPNAGFFPV